MPAARHTHLTNGGRGIPARPLTLHEREEIRAGIERREPDGVIGRRLDRHRCTINAEINRNGGREAYSAVAAQGGADEQRQRPKTPILMADPTLCAHVTARLEAKDSPVTISRQLASGVHGVTGSISHESIYRAIYAYKTRGLRRGTLRAPAPPPSMPVSTASGGRWGSLGRSRVQLRLLPGVESHRRTGDWRAYRDRRLRRFRGDLNGLFCGTALWRVAGYAGAWNLSRRPATTPPRTSLNATHYRFA